MWQQSKYALDFFRDNQVPFQDMMSSKNFNSPVPVKLPTTSTDRLLSLVNSKLHVIYRKVGNATGATLTGLPVGTYDVKWYNPRTGGPVLQGSIISISVIDSAQFVSYGTPPNTPTLDWVIYIRML
jgi:Putative collagen-binding domain of a collagenase